MKNLKIQYSWTNEPTKSIETPHLIFLLKSIKECGSIRAAAFDSGFSYRHVWGEIKRWEDELGNELITWIKGQPATLTDFGEALLKNEALFIAKIAPQIDIIQSHCKLILAKTLNPKLQTLTLSSPHDLCFTELQKRIASDNFQISAQQASNQDSIIALNEGECLIAGIRTLERTSRQGHTSQALKHLLNPGTHKLIGLAQREIGLLLPKHNPLEIYGLKQLSNNKLRISISQTNSATRILINELLSQHDLTIENLSTNRVIENSNESIAASIATGAADVGFGNKASAVEYGLKFIPLAKEQLGLMCLKANLESEELLYLQNFLKGNEWRSDLQHLAGHSAEKSGFILPLKTTYPWWLMESKSRKVA